MTTKRQPIFAESYGLVYRFSRRNWKSMLRAVASGTEVRFNDYGKPICIVSHDITDLDEGLAADLLEVCE